ncbi:HU family DNA-binding protein [Alisedimentitalea sp. MJ-SS2]|uniref:HU family DNA-binding protein n=1 Tax=Aliisedimentitalea sp. MJ-SS2 TaxID=3049795 RepID=UPI0029105506|nr:HU family DNA-binding protein [Alisedimentitalea sp. MJ-SS2]MDU8926722.1 HU family DNA-binding protein [Alisedimentitalea sp. MJ-SS2]
MATRKTTRKSASPRKATSVSKSKVTKPAASVGESAIDAAPIDKTPKVTAARETVKIAPKVAAKPGEAKAPEAAETKTEQPHLRKRPLIDAIAKRSGVKRRDAKAAVEAALEIMGEAIADGSGLNLPGLGKLKVVRTKKLSNAHVYVARIRQADKSARPDPETGGKDPLAEAAE